MNIKPRTGRRNYAKGGPVNDVRIPNIDAMGWMHYGESATEPTKQEIYEKLQEQDKSEKVPSTEAPANEPPPKHYREDPDMETG